ncbi:MAG: hypothetical protein KGN36_15220 [Acidobacteriota bacterium]|nr:hypothetical protein [Acidobacteriota bacterium]
MEKEIRTGLRERRKHRVGKSAFAAIWRWRIAIFLLIGLSALGAGGYRYLRRRATRDGDLRDAMLTLTHQVVRGAVNPDLRASFSDAAETRIQPLSDNRYLVTGWVDLISAQGIAVRHRFSCTIYYDPGGVVAAQDVNVLPE